MDFENIMRVVVDGLIILAFIVYLVAVIVGIHAIRNRDKIKDEWWLTRADKRKRRKAEKEARKQAEAERKKWEAIYARYAD